MIIPYLLSGCGLFGHNVSNVSTKKVKNIEINSVAQEGQTYDAYEAEVWGIDVKAPIKEQGDKSVIKYTGNGFVKNIDYGENCGVTFHNVSVEETGCYPLYVHYCTECDGASFRLYVEDTSTHISTFYSAINCTYKNDWDRFEDYSVACSYINLEKNKNYDIVIKGGHKYAQIDYIKIGNLVSPSMVRYEAENFIEQQVDISDSPFASLGHAAASITENSGVNMRIDIPEDGDYELLINQCSDSSMGEDPGLSVYIDNIFIQNIYCAYKSDYGWGRFDANPVNHVSHTFKAGTHNVRFVKAPGDNNYAQLDYLDLKKQDYVRFEAEEGVTNATVYSDLSASFSGTGYVGDLNKKGFDFVSFNFNTNVAGNYYLRVFYAIGPGVDPLATFTVANNNGNYTTLHCNTVKKWGHFYDHLFEYCSVELEQGENIITLFKENNYAQIDAVELSLFCLETKEGDCQYRRLEAEDANIMNACIKYSGSASNNLYVGDLTENYYLEFPVYVSKDGLYEFCYSYCSPIDNYSAITVSTGIYGRLDIPYINFFRENTVKSDGWGIFADKTVVRYDATSEDLKTIAVNLKAGYSYIVVRPESESKAFELDYIELGRRIGEYDVSSLGIDPILFRGGSNE